MRFLDAQVTASVLLTTASAIAFAQAPTCKSVPVTVDNFARAESDLYMGRTVKDGGLGQFTHNRTPTEIDKQNVIRMNRDTLYSAGVFDLDAGSVTITLPNAGKLHVTAGHKRGSLRTCRDVWVEACYLEPRECRHALCAGCRSDAGRSMRRQGSAGGPRPAGRHQGQPETCRKLRGAELG